MRWDHERDRSGQGRGSPHLCLRWLDAGHALITDWNTVEGMITPNRHTVWIAAAVVLLVSAVRFDGPSRGYWDTYITVPAMFITGQPVDLHKIDGSPRFSYALKGAVPADTFDPAENSFGLASKDQRIGTGILFSAPFALFNKAAFRWGYAATWAVLFVFATLILRRLLSESTQSSPRGPPAVTNRHTAIALFAAAWLVFNPLSLYIDRLNGNLFGLALLTFLWWLMDEERPCWWLVGAVFGMVGGIRNEAIVLAPLFPVFVLLKERALRPAGKALGLCVAAALVTIGPVLLWNDFAYGQAIIHPSQVAHLEGFRPTFPHSFFGSTFDFNGLLNAPFHDTLVRTPHFAFPTFVHWPLVTVQSLGLLLAPLALIGVVQLLRSQPVRGAMLLYWYVIYALLFAFQENWEELKQTFMALHLFPLAVFLAFGIRWLIDGLRSWKRLAIWGCGVGVFAATLLGLRGLEVPADDRWYVRFPHAGNNDAALDGLPVELRKDWQFFYTRETQAEIATERAWMTRLCWLPSIYRAPHMPDRDDLAAMIQEPFEREHRTLAVWSYIYE
jgi:hypothetical protein